jgi:hypothetical protein
MSDIPRRQIAELEFIHRQHPDIYDIYVEGPFDASIMGWFVREHALTNIAIYPIDSIEIKGDDSGENESESGNRSRLVYLASQVSPTIAMKVFCIIDADFSRIQGTVPVTPPLYETDYSCMEMYFFTYDCLSKFFTLFCHRDNWPVAIIMSSLADVLQEFFLFRCANSLLDWHLDWLDNYKCLKVKSWRIELDRKEFIKRLLNKNGKGGDRDTFNRTVESLQKSMDSEPRHQIHGHDFISLLSWFIKEKGITGSRSQIDVVQSSMTLTLDHSRLVEEPLFQKLTELVS